jgi:hypothetical protein
MNPFKFLATFWNLQQIPGWKLGDWIRFCLQFPLTKEKELNYECFVAKFHQY